MTTKNELFTLIARTHLDIPTLQERHRDGLDFHEVGVAALRQALSVAYEAGRASRREKKKMRKNPPRPVS